MGTNFYPTEINSSPLFSCFWYPSFWCPHFLGLMFDVTVFSHSLDQNRISRHALSESKGKGRKKYIKCRAFGYYQYAKSQMKSPRITREICTCLWETRIEMLNQISVRNFNGFFSTFFQVVWHLLDSVPGLD